MNIAMNASLLSVDELVTMLSEANTAYRSGQNVMSDAQYDERIEILRQRDPLNAFLHSVEAEPDFGEGKVVHETPMLSTLKAYSDQEIQAWANKVEQAAKSAGYDVPVKLKMTAKLDGMAGRKIGQSIGSRGDGLVGNKLDHLLSLGMVCTGDGNGEIVVSSRYFDEVLSENYEHPRNFVSGVASADRLKDEAVQAFNDGAVRFVAYETMKSLYLLTSSLVESVSDARSAILTDCEYPTDGVIIEVVDEQIKSVLGSNNSFHNWMIAVKVKGDVKDTTVTGITWQVGRSRRLTPVVNIDPVRIDGATISNVTGKNLGFIEKNSIGIGSRLSIIRAGSVIPDIFQCLSVSEAVEIPTSCPSCGSHTIKDGIHLLCSNDLCSGALSAKINHFFDVVQSIDLFGKKACEKLVNGGVKSATEVLLLSHADYARMGFGDGQIKNMLDNLEKSKSIAVPDYRLLAAFGIHHLGKGDAKKLLKVFPIEQVCHIRESDVKKIKGFGDITAESISRELPLIQSELTTWIDHFGSSLVRTGQEVKSEGELSGKNFVFTGAMSKSREEMGRDCASKGGNVQGSPNSKTTYLVIGDRVGEAKIEKAKKLGINIITEEEYFSL